VNKVNYTRYGTVLYSGSTVWPDNYSLSITTDNCCSLLLTCESTAQCKHVSHLSGSTISCSGSSRTQHMSYPDGLPLIEHRLMSALLHTSIYFPFTPPTKTGTNKTVGFQPFYGKGPHPSLWGDSRVAHRKITVIGTPHYLNYC